MMIIFLYVFIDQFRVYGVLSYIISLCLYAAHSDIVIDTVSYYTLDKFLLNNLIEYIPLPISGIP